MVITLEFSQLTFHSNVTIGSLALQRSVGTEVEGLRLELRFMRELSVVKLPPVGHLIHLHHSTPVFLPVEGFWAPHPWTLNSFLLLEIQTQEGAQTSMDAGFVCW